MHQVESPVGSSSAASKCEFQVSSSEEQIHKFKEKQQHQRHEAVYNLSFYSICALLFIISYYVVSSLIGQQRSGAVCIFASYSISAFWLLLSYYPFIWYFKAVVVICYYLILS